MKRDFLYNLKDQACLGLDIVVLILRGALLKKAIEAIFMSRGASKKVKGPALLYKSLCYG